MKFWMRLAARLYPGVWRKRYAREFNALLEDAEFRWRDLLDVLREAFTMQLKYRTFTGMLAGFGAAGLMVAGVIAIRIPSQYVSQSILQLPPAPPQAQRDRINEAARRVLDRALLAAIVRDLDLYPEKDREGQMDRIVQEMRSRHIQIQTVTADRETTGWTAFTVSFEYDDPSKAQAATRELVKRLQSEMPKSASLEVLDPANRPKLPGRPNRAVLVATGLGCGLLAGLFVFGAGKWPRVAIAAVGAAAVVLIGSYFIPDHYRSRAVLLGSDGKAVGFVAQTATDPAFLRSLVQGPLQLYPGRPVEEAVSEMRNRGLRILPVRALNGRSGAQAMAVEFQYEDESNAFALIRKHDRYKAQAVLREIVGHAIESNLATHSHSRLEVLDPASLPESSYAPNRARMVLIGLLVGFALGALWQFQKPRATPELV